MFRSSDQRQNESARKYLDFLAVAPGLRNAVEVTARALEFPMAFVNILDIDNQYTLAAFGAPDGQVVPRTRSACSSVFRLGKTVVVEDVEATTSEYGDSTDFHRALQEWGIRAYMSVPLYGRESVAIGTLCVADTDSHQIASSQVHLLEQLAVMVEEHLDVQRDKARIGTAKATVDELTHAIDTDQIVPWYEPIIDLESGAVVALEALARWEHPVRGLVSPSEFIGQIENSDLIIDLDLHILSRAVHDFSSWSGEFGSLMLSVNISGLHLERPDCVGRISDLAHDAGVSPTSIILEITETAKATVLRDEERFVTELRRLGFTVLLDDLGSGWSPVGRLLNLPVDGFKLDRSVSAAMHTRIGNAVTRAMLHFAEELGHTVVLEGIDTPAKLEAARGMGFVRGQGHLFSDTVPTEDVPGLLRAQSLSI